MKLCHEGTKTRRHEATRPKKPSCSSCLRGEALKQVSATLLRERVGPHLEFHRLRQRSLAAFNVPRRVRRVARPEPLALPAGIRVVDPSRASSREEAERIRHTQRDEFLARGIKDFH